MFDDKKALEIYYKVYDRRKILLGENHLETILTLQNISLSVFIYLLIIKA